jgi:hypothetical protein
MVRPDLQSAIEAMSLGERLELIQYIESTIESEPIEFTAESSRVPTSRPISPRTPMTTSPRWVR